MFGFICTLLQPETTFLLVKAPFRFEILVGKTVVKLLMVKLGLFLDLFYHLNIVSILGSSWTLQKQPATTFRLLKVPFQLPKCIRPFGKHMMLPLKWSVKTYWGIKTYFGIQTLRWINPRLKWFIGNTHLICFWGTTIVHVYQGNCVHICCRSIVASRYFPIL